MDDQKLDNQQAALNDADATTDQQLQLETHLSPEHQEALQALELLLSSNDYAHNIADVKGAGLRKEIAQLEKKSTGKARGALAKLQQEAAFQQLKQEGEDINAVRARVGKKEWKRAVNNVDKVEIDIDGQKLPVGREKALQFLTVELQDDNTRERLSAIQDELGQQEQNVRDVISRLKDELREKQNDPKFLHAVDAWGKSPNLQMQTGENGKGYNAGIIHFFEYRANKEKAGKFKNEPESAFSLQGFVDYTAGLNQYVIANDGELNSMPDVRHFARFRDESGQERLYLDTKRGHVIAFKGADEDNFRIVTVITTGNPNQAWKKFQKSVTSVGSQDESGRLNQLGNNAQLVGSDEETKSL